MQVIHPGICYQLDDGNLTKVVFAHHDARLKVNVSGTSIEELMAIIRHKMAVEADKANTELTGAKGKQ